MIRRTKTFSLAMLMTVFLAAGFADQCDAVIAVSIILALLAIVTDMIRPGDRLKILSVIFSVFSATYALVTPHFNALEEVYGLARSSDKTTDKDTVSVVILYGLSTLIIAVGVAVKSYLINNSHKKLNVPGGL